MDIDVVPTFDAHEKKGKKVKDKKSKKDKKDKKDKKSKKDEKKTKSPKHVEKADKPKKVEKQKKNAVSKKTKKGEKKVTRRPLADQTFSLLSIQEIMQMAGGLGGLRSKGNRKHLTRYLNSVSNAYSKRGALICMLDKRCNINDDVIQIIDYAHTPCMNFVLSRKKEKRRAVKAAPKENESAAEE